MTFGLERGILTGPVFFAAASLALAEAVEGVALAGRLVSGGTGGATCSGIGATGEGTTGAVVVLLLVGAGDVSTSMPEEGARGDALVQFLDEVLQAGLDTQGFANTRRFFDSAKESVVSEVGWNQGFPVLWCLLKKKVGAI